MKANREVQGSRHRDHFPAIAPRGTLACALGSILHSVSQESFDPDPTHQLSCGAPAIRNVQPSSIRIDLPSSRSAACGMSRVPSRLVSALCHGREAERLRVLGGSSRVDEQEGRVACLHGQ
jgi:hypothetical protein